MAAEALKRQVENKHNIQLAKEDASWAPAELKKLDRTLSKLPDSLVKFNPKLKAFVRAHKQASPPGAPGDAKRTGSKITIYDQGAKGDMLPESVIHEIAHTVEHSNPVFWRRWLAASGWERSGGKWGHSKNPGFVYEYSKTDPREDFATALTSAILRPLTLKKISPIKSEMMAGFLETLG